MDASKSDKAALGALLAARLKEAMRERPACNSQLKLAAASGMSQSAISKILSGNADPGLSTLYALANGLGMPLAALLADVPVQPAQMLSSQALALAHLPPLPRAFVDVALRVLEAGEVDDAECARLVSEWCARLPVRVR